MTSPASQRFAEAVGRSGPVTVRGHGSHQHDGASVTSSVRVVTAPAGIIEHRPSEMTVRLHAGTPIAELSAALAAAGQRTALPDGPGTVGGALALGRNDIAALGRGSIRSCLLGMTYVSDDGLLVRAGGSTVKNVTGYDLPRLMVGAHGTLGFLADVTLRTNPIPARASWYRLTEADPFLLSESLHRPAAVLWDGASSWILLEGDPADVAQQRRVAAAHGAIEEVAGPPPLPPERWSLPPADLRSLRRGDVGPFVACVGLGVVHATTPQPPAVLPGPLLQLMRRVKHAFDPTGRLNPGRAPRGLS